MHSGGNIALKQNSAVSVYIGIASLVLEGRPLVTDEDDDDGFSKKFEPTVSQQEFSVEKKGQDSTGSGSSTRHHVFHRISEKLMQLRQFPGSNKEIVETTMAIPTQSRDDCEYERQVKLHHVASAREFLRNPRHTAIPSSSTSGSSSAASVLHDIDVDWNDISIVFNGLDSLINIPGSPMISSSSPFKSAIPIHPALLNTEHSLKIFKPKEKVVGKHMSKPKQGPHCDKFLKKIGIVKVDPLDSENDHMCNHVNSYCRRWQLHLKMLLQILSKGEDACIEIYLGPENNAILLEQWMFQLKESTTPSSMTIQSLCNAIRSQMYFSQISSWNDLLRKAFVEGGTGVKDQMPNLLSPEIMQNPRLKKNLETMQVDLDILFRIKPFDGTACFDEKPNVHNFPDTIVSDKISLRICLKSLPRLERIPTLNTEKAHSNGFSCDNRIKTSHGVSVPMGSPVAGSSCHLLHDRLAYPSCHEKGKHRCKEEEEEDYGLEMVETAKTSAPIQEAMPAPIPAPAPPPASTVSNLTHRERQLLKYKKRLMKREKQKKKVLDGDQLSVSSLNTSGSDEFEKFQDTAINDTFAPLYGVNSNSSQSKTEPTANTHQQTLKTLSIATQTENLHCSNCGENLQCWNCDRNQINLKNPSIGSVVGTMIGNKADLLLQAIQRTANAHPTEIIRDNEPKNNIFTNSKSSTSVNANDAGNCDTSKDNNNYLINNNNNNGDKSDGQADCRLCKRQKTRHTYASSMSVSSNSSSGSYRRTMSECLVGAEEGADGCTMSFSPLPTHKCDDNEFNYATDESLSFGELKAYRRAFSDEIINQIPSEACCFESNDNEDCQCMKKPVSTNLKLTPNVTLQARSVDLQSPHKKLVIREQQKKQNQHQKIPKINLSHVFDSIQDDSGIMHDFSASSDNVFVLSSQQPNSFSPAMKQLSPRCLLDPSLKRRSRNISDRSSMSEYSNVSDEEDDLNVRGQPTSTSKISSLFKKFVNKTQTTFNKLPLLGTIEESLLHDRFQPKAIVNGFKLLLGASGSFCPTQLTIPAQTYFYEFQGLKHLSTPYVCDFRLARRGYSIPRTGTVQATLLNPQGTVVRMFFVPYDFRDMPAMSQTFMRQRVLAIDEHISQKEAEQMSTVEQMKHLRYVVHLRFQTGRSGRLCLHTDIKLLISRRTEFDTAQAHAKNSLESPNDLKTIIIMPDGPKFSSRIDRN